MKNQIIALAVAMMLLLFSSLTAQITFERWYGGRHGRSVDQTSDGGYVITGWADPYGPNWYQVFLIKTDSLGDTLWTRKFGHGGDDLGYSVMQTADGGYFIAGWTEMYMDDFYLVKTNANGDTIWTRNHGGNDRDRCFSGIQTFDGGYGLAGGTASYGAGSWDVYFVKTDTIGDTLWTKTYGGTQHDQAHSVIQTSDRGYAITGYTYSFGVGLNDVYLIKTDSLGDTLWTRTFGDSSADVGNSILETSDGGYIIAGTTNSYGAGSEDIYLIKTDSHGDFLWKRTYGRGDSDFANSVVETPNGGYIIVGGTKSFGLEWPDVYLLRTDSLGDTLWTRRYGHYWIDYGSCVKRTQDGGYIISGYTSNYYPGSVYLLKTDSLGNIGVGIDEDEGTKKNSLHFLEAFPNPFTTMTNLQLVGSSKKQKANLTIHDAAGRLVKSVKLATNTYQLGADLVPGVYFLKVTIGEHEEIQKLIKIR